MAKSAVHRKSQNFEALEIRTASHIGTDVATEADVMVAIRPVALLHALQL